MEKLNFPTGVGYSDEVSGRWYPYGVGIDCHRDMVWACVLRPVYDTGKQQRELCKFATSLAGLRDLREWLEARVPFEHRRVLVESTSTYHFPVLRALPAWRPTVINPMLVGSAKRKTDRWDAQTLAHHSMAGTFPEYVIPTSEELALRSCYRRWLKIGGSITRCTNALRTRMTMFGVNYPFNANTNIGWAVMKSMCLGVPIPRHLARTRTLWPAVEYDALVSALPKSVVSINALQLAAVDTLRAERIAAFEVCLAACPTGAVALLCTVPHVKETSAICFLSEIGFDPRRRFHSVNGIVAYSGFDPSKRVSADSVTSHLPSAGSRHLRHTMLQVAGGAMLARGRLAKHGAEVAARTGKRGWHAARNAVGRKLVRWLAAVHFSGTPFTEGYQHGCKSAWFEPDDALAGLSPGIDVGVPPAADWDGAGSAPHEGDWGEGPLGDAAGGDPWQGWEDSVLRGEW